MATFNMDAEGPSMSGDGTTAMSRDSMEIIDADNRTFRSQMRNPDGSLPRVPQSPPSQSPFPPPRRPAPPTPPYVCSSASLYNLLSFLWYLTPFHHLAWRFRHSSHVWHEMWRCRRRLPLLAQPQLLSRRLATKPPELAVHMCLVGIPVPCRKFRQPIGAAEPPQRRVESS